MTFEVIVNPTSFIRIIEWEEQDGRINFLRANDPMQLELLTRLLRQAGYTERH